MPPLPAILRRPLGHLREPRSRIAALHRLHASPVAGAADQWLGAALVASRSPQCSVGLVEDVLLPESDETQRDARQRAQTFA
ncbi:MAG: hypothetical protein PHQ34_03610 [Methanothrix sp.]|nr:hypothetical protein [Methanothrix sp.]